jgi:hypothetical protein
MPSSAMTLMDMGRSRRYSLLNWRVDDGGDGGKRDREIQWFCATTEELFAAPAIADNK